MLKRNLTIMLIGALILSLIASPLALAKSKEEKAAEFAAKVKSEIGRLGTGPDARIEIKLRNKTRLKGFVSGIGEESFIVTSDKTGVTTEVPYPDVAKVKGNNLSTGAIIAISAGIGVGLTFLIIYLIYLANES